MVGNALLERDLACDALGCIYRAGNTAIGIVLHGDALAEDCAMLTGIVSVEPTRGACQAAKLLIDRFDLFDNGAYAVWLTADGEAIVQDVASSLGQRPWVLRRGPEIEEPEPATDDAAAAAEAQD